MPFILMTWNLYNSIILGIGTPLAMLSAFRMFLGWNRPLHRYLYAFILLALVVILQVVLIDIGLTKTYPLLLLFYMPFQFLCPALFTAFAYTYTDQLHLFKKYKWYFFAPFIIFFGLYSFLKINVINGYAWISAQTAANIGAEWDENSALTLSLLAALWNYRLLKNYERGMGNLPHQVVLRKTEWLKTMYLVMVVLSLLWLGVIVGIKLIDSWSGHGPYYPLWGLFIIFYYLLFFMGNQHLRMVHKEKESQRKTLESFQHNFQVSELQKVFNETEILSIQESQSDVTEILSYFATSLFDKKNEDEVVWDITKNCISKLGLEDCVLYIWNDAKGTLQQKAAHGEKEFANRKILSPIEIPLGKGIVGAAAQNQKWELVNDLEADTRYIEDDKKRCSELAVPLVYENRLLGVLDSENSEKNFFKERHLLLFQLIAKLTSTKLGQLGSHKTFELTDDNVHYQELLLWFATDKPYLNPYLSLSTVSQKLKISVGYLSQIVNKLEQTNFSEFSNKHRVEEAKQILVNPSYSGYTIVSIGLESGFNSKSAFYTAFKKYTGLTPSEFRQRHLILS
ncbi:MAG: helix-turn-helix domain-containing protein [Bacteroidota bacterium]